MAYTITYLITPETQIAFGKQWTRNGMLIILWDWFYLSHFIGGKMKAKTWGLTSSHLASQWQSCDSKAYVPTLPLLALKTH